MPGLTWDSRKTSPSRLSEKFPTRPADRSLHRSAQVGHRARGLRGRSAEVERGQAGSDPDGVVRGVERVALLAPQAMTRQASNGMLFASRFSFARYWSDAIGFEDSARSVCGNCGRRTRTSSRSTASTSRCPSGECFGLLGPNGAGKTTTIEICEGLTDAGSRRGRAARPALEADAARAAPAARHPASGNAALREAHGRGDRARCSAASTAQDRDVDGGHRAGAARREARRARRAALRRPEAAARDGLRAGRRSRPPVPRRADHRPRSAVAPPALGPGRAASSAAAAPSSSPPTTWTRPSGSATASPSWTTASIIALGTPRELIASLGAEHVVEFAVDGRVDAGGARRASMAFAARAASGARISSWSPTARGRARAAQELGRAGRGAHRIAHALGDARRRLRVAHREAPAR